MIAVKFLLFVGLIASLYSEVLSFSCKNEKGQDVDWFVLLKPPKRKSTDPNLSNGGGYGFIDSNDKNAGWKLGTKDLDNVGSYTGQTFAEVYKNPEKYSYIQYNDAKPEGLGHDSTLYAHAKGALVWNNNDAVWIVHSTPKFLPIFHSKKYDFPKTGKNHGQNFLCLSLDAKKYVNPILNHIVTMKAQVYGNHISSSMDKAMSAQIQENINILAKKMKDPKELKDDITKVDDKRIKELTTEVKTKGGESFTAVAKSRRESMDIWSAIASPALKAKELAVKTWTLLQKATALLGSSCSREKVLNINDMDIKFTNSPLTVEWSKNDHSKWGICTNGGNNCYCAGDMNRATSQFHRGGGVVCMHNSNVHETFQKSFKNQFNCGNKVEDNPKK